MATCTNKGFLRVFPLVYQQVRFSRNRPNIQRPKHPHFLKSKLLAVTKPIYEEDTRPPIDKCLKPVQIMPPVDLDALDKIYASELRDMFKTSALSAIFTRCNYDFHEMHQAKILFFKANMKIVVRNKHIVKEAIGDTEFRNLLPLFDAVNFMVFSPEANISSLVSINQKLPHYHLLCAVVDGRILSFTQLQSLASIPDIDTARASIVQTLLSGAQSVAQGLQSHQNTLVQQLKQRVDQLQSTPEGKDQ
ncbi:39S ribosomal protein L10, mitochondrial [Thrips palmi]|uniref:Large ribosomal subunit protein uL10m n=1 Tax=Thrips palmi TaxID=161013 RepID=A0A6P8YDQ4_THRPL|nr:39S ribosomal protein L10, mitochondrial [Thrips palmi]